MTPFVADTTLCDSSLEHDASRLPNSLCELILQRAVRRVFCNLKTSQTSQKDDSTNFVSNTLLGMRHIFVEASVRQRFRSDFWARQKTVTGSVLCGDSDLFLGQCGSGGDPNPLLTV